MNDNDSVTLQTWNLSEIILKQLNIPGYQRSYCWSEDNVLCLLDDIRNIDSEYRLGTVILQKNKDSNTYDIIDGQQRLVTLALLVQLLTEKSNIPLSVQKLLTEKSNIPLSVQKFESEYSNKYIAYNKYLINTYLARYKPDTFKNIFANVTFNVLILNDETSLDLAYTFFSNQNSKGFPLTDFDLLKAHHLRYVFDETQASHLAKNWDRMLLNGQNQENESQNSGGYLDRDYVRTLQLYIFRLRKWLGFEDWDENEKHIVKKEFEAAKIIKEIPPFGEQFQYKEPIQGGPHFFAYVELFVERFQNFKSTPQYDILHKTLKNETHYWLRDVIEALLFAYYLKFGQNYLTEAMVLLIFKISKIRYNNGRLYHKTLLEHIKESKITHFIDIATSPTFFLAELKNDIELIEAENQYSLILQNKNNNNSKFTAIQKRFCEKQKAIFKELQEKSLFKADNIRNMATYDGERK